MRRRAMLCNSRRTWGSLLALCAALGGFSACKRRAPEPAPSAQPSASAAPVALAPRCAEPFPGKSFTLGDRPSEAPDGGADEDDDGADQPALPFAVEVGRAVAFGDGFAVSALSTKAGKTTALVALLDAEAGAGRIAELGKLHADPDPPELAVFEDDLVALVHDSDAGGELLKLAAVRPGAGKVDVVLGAEVAESRDESRVADLELGPERGVAVWDEWSSADKHGVIVSASFARKDVSNVTKKRIVSTPSEDAEAPRVVRRPGGFWAAWIARAVAPKQKALPPKKPAAPAPSAAPAQEPADPAVVDLGERYLSAVPLDQNGVPTSEPKPISPKSAHVLVFDMAAGADGSAIFSWRDDDAAPGTEERRIHLARVKSDGTVERHIVDDEGTGVGAPTLLVDASPKDPSAPHAWLSLDSVSDTTRIGAVSSSANLLDALGPEPVVRSAELLTVARGRLLAARPRGLAMELSVVECKPGPAPSAAPASSAP